MPEDAYFATSTKFSFALATNMCRAQRESEAHYVYLLMGYRVITA